MLELDKKKSIPGAKYNVLNDYRSYTPMFTLACLDRDALKNPESYRKSSLDYVILKSGGKDKGFNVNAAKGVVAGPDSGSSKLDAKTLVEGFNKESPGRFDMFLDNLEFECVIAPGEKQGTSVATNIRFEVFEPLSLNGFLEALHVAAVAAGFESYAQASFLLKIEFYGYPDDDDLPTPKVIENSSRYFVFNFTGVEITVTEQGTKYVCQGVPNGDMAFAEPDKILTDIKMTGSTVAEVLRSFFLSVNKTVVDRAVNEKKEGKSGNHDSYEIVFPDSAANGEKLELSKTADNVLSKAKMAPYLTNNSVLKMVPIEKKGKPGESKAADAQANATDSTSEKTSPTPQSQGMKYEPQGGVIQFSQGSKISEIVTAVIRDSLYLENIMKDIGAAKDEHGMIDYFLIQINVIPKSELDDITGLPLNTYQYVIIPHKVHFTKLPLQKGVAHDPEDLMPIVKRVYNYIYTGKNLDILSFRLQFNSLYFQAMPPKAGNESGVEQANAMGPNGTTKVTVTASDTKDNSKSKLPSVYSRPSDQDQTKGGRAGAPRTDPYYKFAEFAHNAILESVDQATAEMEIVGDPFYLVMGGIGNQLPTKAEEGLTTDGTADHQAGQVLIRVNFRNPNDIDPETGLVSFSKNFVSYGGIYQVTTVKSNFKEGQFKQSLSLIRVPGQITDDGIKPEDPGELITKPKPGAQVVADSAPATVDKAGVRPSTFDVTKLLSRGLPSIGLPGNLSDFAGVLKTGGSTLLGAVAGASNLAGDLSGIAKQVGLPGGNINFYGISNAVRASAGTLNGVANIGLGTAALLGSAGKIAGSALNSKSASSDLTTNVANQASDSALQLTNATLSSDVAGAATGNISNLTSLASNAGSSALSAVKSIGGSAVDLVSGIGNKVKGLAGGLPTDPTALAQNLGVNPSQLAGLGGKLQSKAASQLGDLAKDIPTDVDIDAVTKSGVSLANLSADSLKNIPATAKELIASAPELPDIKKISPDALSKINSARIAGGLTSLSAADINLSTAGLPSLNSLNATALAGKLGSAKSMMASATGLSAGSIESGLSNLTSLTGGNSIAGFGVDSISDLGKSVTSKFGSMASKVQSPLDKLVSSSNNNNQGEG
jgi:hypothetical protein